MYFSNSRKYDCGHPKFHSAHHVAYIPHISDLVRDVYREHYQQPPSDNVLQHLKQEVMQAVWKLILDEEFLDAYENSVVLPCYDKVSRRFLPEFFSYSADYPEKVSIICIKHLGNCLCVRCIIQKCHVRLLGTHADSRWRISQRRTDSIIRQNLVKTARWHIFVDGRGVESSIVKQLLDNLSLTPIINIFSKKLFPLGFDIYSLLTVDQLHEFEIGVWKAVLTHLIRMLLALKDSSIKTLDEHFRHVPTYGRDTIRCFHNNVSEMKKLAARDFEDILQCAIPCLDGLFPKQKHNNMVQALLFDLATWHAYAKLCLHTDSTVSSLERATTQLRKSLWTFQNEAKKFDTYKTPKEMESRHRREAAAEKKSQRDTGSTREEDTNGKGKAKKKASGHKKKEFNISTAKMHFLGDYAHLVKEYGMTDSYTTRNSKCQYQQVKHFYCQTNKQKYTNQVIRHEQWSRVIRMIGQAVKTAPKSKKRKSGAKQVVQFVKGSEHLPKTDPSQRYHIGHGQENQVNLSELGEWVDEDKDKDPALENFIPKLKDHLIHRLLGPQSKTEYTDTERTNLSFTNDCIYAHKVPWINYNTYDRRRSQDSVNPSGRGEQEEEDWRYYHVNMFVDRDMLMRYCGGAVGHIQFQEYEHYFVKDAGLDKHDLPKYDENGEEMEAGDSPDEGEEILPNSLDPGTSDSDSDTDSQVMSGREDAHPSNEDSNDREAAEQSDADLDFYEHASLV
ncbi:hypothetical protein AAF712_010696 [Marasmius tenuissimus]|uniref:Uncharacterized protein n=1 Tax=Marasmius tenuissimus TaxID=585030 RepID=A0ABR2ZL71_9AGAR